MDINELSPAAQDYLKVIWSAVEWGDPPITTKGIAARLGTSQANVSDMARRLASQGLLHYEPYKPLVLTPLGERLARGMVRRHRLIETFLTEVLGYGWEEVHDDAELLEHAASQRFLDRLDTLLGHPTHDPHGDPIPDPSGEIAPARAPLVRDATPGTYTVVRVSDEDPDALAGLGALGVVPGAELVVTADGAQVDGGPLTAEQLALVRVRRR